MEWKKVVDKAITAVRHNQGLAVGIVLAVCLAVWGTGCDSTVESLRTPGKMVTRDMIVLEVRAEQSRLEAELEQLIARAESRANQLDRQDAIKRQLFNLGLVVLEGGTLNPLAFVPIIAGIIGIGAIADNRRKDGIIAGRKMGAGNGSD